MKYYKASSDFVLRCINEMYVLVPVGRTANKFGNLFLLNETALFMWKNLCDQKCTINCLTKLFLNEYEVDAETAKQNIVSAINTFTEIGAVELSE